MNPLVSKLWSSFTVGWQMAIVKLHAGKVSLLLGNPEAYRNVFLTTTI
jgi:hypothetical protein